MADTNNKDNKDMPARLLHLIAHDIDDLNIMSAILQDAVLLANDMVWDKPARIFAFMANRFRWEAQKARPEYHQYNERIRTGMHFHGVTNVQNHGIKQNSQQVLSLLTLQFEPSESLSSPAGYIRFVFSGDAELRLTVEALNVIMQDVTPSWPTANRPKHN